VQITPGGLETTSIHEILIDWEDIVYGCRATRQGHSVATAIKPEMLIRRSGVRTSWPPKPEEVEAILRAYKPTVSAIAQSYFIRGADRDDVLQEGMIGLWKAIRDFRPGAGRSFDTFAKLCVRRQIITAVKTAMRPKQRMLSDCLSLDMPVLDECTLSDAVADETTPNVLDVVLKRDGLGRVLGNDEGHFSPFELDVARLYSQGYSYMEIAAEVGCSLKSVDCALFRVKRKLRNHALAET
jgi:RNA polymerase sporulation-specific sigma factor